MSLGPKDPDKRWNMWLVVGLVVFSGWVALVVLSSAFGSNKEVQDDALLIGAAGTFIALLLGNFRHSQKIEQVYEHVNNVEEREALLTRMDAKLDTLLEREG